MADIEKIFKNADFGKGSGHKGQLHDRLFAPGKKTGGVLLDDEDLEKVAGGAIYDPSGLDLPSILSDTDS